MMVQPIIVYCQVRRRLPSAPARGASDWSTPHRSSWQHLPPSLPARPRGHSHSALRHSIRCRRGRTCGRRTIRSISELTGGPRGSHELRTRSAFVRPARNSVSLRTPFACLWSVRRRGGRSIAAHFCDPTQTHDVVPWQLFVGRTNALKKFIPNFRVVSCRIQNRCILVNRETLFGHGLCKLIVRLRYDTLFLGGCFRFGDALPVVLLETYNAFHRCRSCTKLLIRQVRCGGRRTGRRGLGQNIHRRDGKITSRSY